MPIIDVAIADAYKQYIRHWYPASPHWLQIHESPVLQCDDQKRAAWASLEAIQWTNGSGVRVEGAISSIHRLLCIASVDNNIRAGL